MDSPYNPRGKEFKSAMEAKGIQSFAMMPPIINCHQVQSTRQHNIS
jgi:hypothetical protein